MYCVVGFASVIVFAEIESAARVAVVDALVIILQQSTPTDSALAWLALLSCFSATAATPFLLLLSTSSSPRTSPPRRPAQPRPRPPRRRARRRRRGKRRAGSRRASRRSAPCASRRPVRAGGRPAAAGALCCSGRAGRTGPSCGRAGREGETEAGRERRVLSLVAAAASVTACAAEFWSAAECRPTPVGSAGQGTHGRAQPQFYSLSPFSSSRFAPAFAEQQHCVTAAAAAACPPPPTVAVAILLWAPLYSPAAAADDERRATAAILVFGEANVNNSDNVAEKGAKSTHFSSIA